MDSSFQLAHWEERERRAVLLEAEADARAKAREEAEEARSIERARALELERTAGLERLRNDAIEEYRRAHEEVRRAQEDQLRKEVEEARRKIAEESAMEKAALERERLAKMAQLREEMQLELQKHRDEQLEELKEVAASVGEQSWSWDASLSQVICPDVIWFIYQHSHLPTFAHAQLAISKIKRPKLFATSTVSLTIHTLQLIPLSLNRHQPPVTPSLSKVRFPVSSPPLHANHGLGTGAMLSGRMYWRASDSIQPPKQIRLAQMNGLPAAGCLAASWALLRAPCGVSQESSFCHSRFTFPTWPI